MLILGSYSVLCYYGVKSLGRLKLGLIYIYKALCPSVRCPLLFVPRGQTICLSPGGQTFLTHSWGGTNIFLVRGGGKNFHTQLGGGTNIFYLQRVQMSLYKGGGQTFSYDHDNDRECERSEHFFERSEEAPCRG